MLPEANEEWGIVSSATGGGSLRLHCLADHPGSPDSSQAIQQNSRLHLDISDEAIA